MTAFEKILERLEACSSKITRNSSGAVAQCPAHEDGRPSLSVRSTSTRARVHCFAGCADVDILAALQLGVRDLYDAPRVTYDYGNGYRVHRLTDGQGGKDFRQSNAPAGPKPLYRLDQVQAAIAAGRTVYLVEGEEDVHAIEAAGATGTTAPMGAPNLDKADLTPLSGAHVIAVGDQDKAGGQWAAKVAELVGPIAASLSFLRPVVGKDFSDHWAAGGTLASLVPCEPASPNQVDVLGEVEEFVARFVAYPSEAARIAHTLWIAHTWLMEQWESTPRIAFLSPEPGSGKSRALEVTEPLVPRAIHAVNTTPAYLFRKVSDPDGAPTILYDEIDTVFGPKAKDNEDVRGMLNAGHRRGATAGRCTMRGKVVVTEELPAYCAVALAGLDDLPDTIRSRSVIIRMRRRAPGERVEPWRHRIHARQGQAIAEKLAAWSSSISLDSWPEMPVGIEDRDADMWEPLLAVAELAGQDWLDRARCAAVTLVTAARQDARQTLGVQLLADLRRVFVGDAMFTETILTELTALEDAPWSDLRGKPLDSRGLAQRLRRYELKPGTVRIGDQTKKGYSRADLHDLWTRYLPVAPASAVTSVTPSQSGSAPAESVTDSPLVVTDDPSLVTDTDPEIPAQRDAVTVVTDIPGEPGTDCRSCGQPLTREQQARGICGPCYLKSRWSA